MSIPNPNLPRLCDLVSVRTRFSRSVHLERDSSSSRHAGYHLTPSAFELLRAIAHAWERPSDRALTVVGPYGAGKSAFCVFLAALASGSADQARQLREHDAPLADALAAPERRLLPVLLVGSREPLARALVQGLVHALESRCPELLGEMKREWAQVLAEHAPAPRDVARLFEAAAQGSMRHGWGGVLLLADELGKFLEHAALHPREGDIFALQELAEAAARSRSPLFVLAVLHQNAEDYASKLGREQQAEWAKVGERFREVPFFPSDAERMDMVGLALQHSPELRFGAGFERLAARGAALLPRALSERFAEMARAAYPLHPLALLALPPLLRKAGQSHRSLFNFLSGEEAHALGRFLRENAWRPNEPPLFRPEHLFGYATEVLLGGWSSGALARAWADAVEAVDQAREVSPLARRALQCIALLGLLREPALPASPQVLAWALADASEEACGVGEPDGIAAEVQEALDDLLERRLIAWSRTRQRYRLFEGGDVDIEAALEAARAALPERVTLSVLERDESLLPPLMARRHSFETGTLRLVETVPCTPDELEPQLKARGGLCVVLCLAQNADEAARAEAMARVAGPQFLVAVARETEILREAAREVAASDEVGRNPALDGDRAARRELEARRFEAESALRDEWSRVFGPASSARWRYCGEPMEFASGRAFSVFLSRMANETFPNAPSLRNELINRRSLSSSAAAGRRALIEAMLLHPSKPNLGIEGFPPERAMYECLLRAPGLHREPSHKGSSWTFGPPSQGDPSRLLAVWQVLEAEIFAFPPAPRAVESLWSKLCAPPFGLSEGVMPPLLLAFLLAHAHETTLYREGTYVPEPTVADWEILLRRPELFAVAGSRADDARAHIVERLASGLGSEPYAVPIAQALVRNMRRLPEYAKHTAKLPEETKALRRALESVASPEKLLFHDLPAALGVSGLFSGAGAGEVDGDAFFAILNRALTSWSEATPAMIARARDTLLAACGLPPGEEGWALLRRECAELQGRVADAKLIPFVDRAGAPGEDGAVLESVLALVANRPPRAWSDSHEERFEAQAFVTGEMFRDRHWRGEQSEPTVTTSPAPSTSGEQVGAASTWGATSNGVATAAPLSKTERERIRRLADAFLSRLQEKWEAPRHIQLASPHQYWWLSDKIEVVAPANLCLFKACLSSSKLHL